MRKLLLTTLAFISLQTPVFAQVKISNADLYKLGERRGILTCAALKNNARTVEELSDMIISLNDPEVTLLTRIYRNLSDAQKDVVFAGMDKITLHHCRYQYEVFMRNNL